MLDVMLCFHIHQPYRLCTIRLFDRCAEFFDNGLNRAVLEKVSQACYAPASNMLGGLAERYSKDFKCAFSITGTVVEQLKMWNPDVLERLRGLASTSSVELIGETYYHSLFSLFDREEFIYQVSQHAAMMKREFSALPTVFRNTELLYEDRVSDYLGSFDQYRVLLCEDVAADQIAARSPQLSYNDLHLLLFRDHVLTDDIAFRFSNHEQPNHVLTADTFFSRLRQCEELLDDSRDPLVLLYMDYETLGEHHRESDGIFTFFQDMAESILSSTHMRFSFPSDSLRQPRDQMNRVSVKRPVSWADSEKDLSAWLSSDLQKNAMNTMLEVWARAKRRGDEDLLERMRRLSSSDHLYYMYPWKGGADAEVHRHFSPYDSPEEAYMRYMAALAALELQL